MPGLPATWYRKYKFWAKGQKSVDCKPAMHAKATLMYFRLSLLFSREQRCYRMLFRLIGGRRNIPKQRDLSNVETYDQKQVFDSFFERGILCSKPESALKSGKRRSFVLFVVTCVWNKFMLHAVVVTFESGLTQMCQIICNKLRRRDIRGCGRRGHLNCFKEGSALHWG